jgi:hypothetical protein
MPYRRCRNPHKTDGPTLEQIVVLAMEKLQWPRKKVLSWVEKENPSLKYARPRELVDRGQGELVIELLNKRERDRKKEDKRREEKKNEKR